MKQLIAFAKINIGGGDSWEEDFKVSSKETAESEIKEVVEYFNSSLKRGEKPRSFEGITRFEEKEIVEQNNSLVDDEYNDDEDWY